MRADEIGAGFESEQSRWSISAISLLCRRTALPHTTKLSKLHRSRSSSIQSTFKRTRNIQCPANNSSHFLGPQADGGFFGDQLSCSVGPEYNHLRISFYYFPFLALCPLKKKNKSQYISNRNLFICCSPKCFTRNSLFRCQSIMSLAARKQLLFFFYQKTIAFDHWLCKWDDCFWCIYVVKREKWRNCRRALLMNKWTAIALRNVLESITPKTRHFHFRGFTSAIFPWHFAAILPSNGRSHPIGSKTLLTERFSSYLLVFNNIKFYHPYDR